MFEMAIGEGGLVKLKGRLDAAEADRALEELGAVQGPVTIDFAELDYISSAGIGVIIETFKRLKAAGHDFRLVSMTPRVRNVFTYAGLDRLLKIE